MSDIYRIAEDKLEHLQKLIEEHSWDAYVYFANNCLGRNHLETFTQAKPLAKYTKVWKIGNYLVIKTRKRSWKKMRYDMEVRKLPEDKAGYYSAVFIVGVDETLRFFCHRLPWRFEFETDAFFEQLTEEDIRKMMGFEKHAIESEYLEDGRTRLQGDIVVVKRSITWDELIKYIEKKVKNSLYSETMKERVKLGSIFRAKVRNASRTALRLLASGIKSKNEGYILLGLEMVFGNLSKTPIFSMILSNMLENMKKDWSDITEKDMYWMLVSAVNIAVDKFIDFAFENSYWKACFKRKLKWLRESEKKITLRIGHHVFRFIGVPANTFFASLFTSKKLEWWENRSFIILRDTEIQATHDEHIPVSVKIRAPALIVFDTLRAHIRQVRRS